LPELIIRDLQIPRRKPPSLLRCPDNNAHHPKQPLLEALLPLKRILPNLSSFKDRSAHKHPHLKFEVRVQEMERPRRGLLLANKQIEM
jgi:hypothetical protein